MAMNDKAQLMFDSKALAKHMREQLAKPVHDKAVKVQHWIESNVPEDVDVVVRDDINEDGRPVSLVQIQHASGLARQANDGVMTQAAAQEGLDIRRYNP